MRLIREQIMCVKNRHPIEEMIRACGVPLSPRGERQQTPCPFPEHEDAPLSFLVSPRAQPFRCFGCGLGGDVFDFLQHDSSWSFSTALQHLTGKREAFLTTPAVRQRGTSRASAKDGASHLPEDPSLTRMLTEATHQYCSGLLRTSHVLQYARGRGSKEQTARALPLGYSNGRTLLPYLAHEPEGRKRAFAAGLLTPIGRERLASRLMIPEIRGGQAHSLIAHIVPAFQEPLQVPDRKSVV